MSWKRLMSALSMSNDQYHPCSCIKLNCVKLYCSCFGTYRFCSQNCYCIDCKNCEYNEDFVEERAEIIRMKNPSMFGPKIVRVEGPMVFDPQSSNAVPGDEEWMYAEGCRCRKSKCLELVCECLKHEVRCTAKCRCIECGNGPGIKSGYRDSNTETDHCDASGLTYEESILENTTQYEETSNRNKRPTNF